jgi:predicted CopG family antitoxin
MSYTTITIPRRLKEEIDRLRGEKSLREFLEELIESLKNGGRESK